LLAINLPPLRVGFRLEAIERGNALHAMEGKYGEIS